MVEKIRITEVNDIEKKYEVAVEKSVSNAVVVVAKDKQEATQKVWNMIDNGEITFFEDDPEYYVRVL